MIEGTEQLTLTIRFPSSNILLYSSFGLASALLRTTFIYLKFNTNVKVTLGPTYLGFTV